MYGAILVAAFAGVLLDAFVIPKSVAAVPELPAASAPSAVSAPPAEPQPSEPSEVTALEPEPLSASTEPVTTASSYIDDNIQITVETARNEDTTFYVADIQLSEPSYLKAALAQDTFGRNIKETTSQMAEAHNAIFAINGDYYGFRDEGYVLRNGVLYRENGVGDALLIDSGGGFSIVEQGSISPEIQADAWQVFAFGPALIEDGMVVVDEGSEVSRSRSGNPRTAIGQISDLHYLVIVSDGRTEESQGLSLLELAQEFARRGAVTAYNLDGGGSSTMVLNGQVINIPTSGRSKGERAVSDIVYIGYE